MEITGVNIIGNKVSFLGSNKFYTFCPEKNQENEWIFSEAVSEEIEAACQLASGAYRSFRKLEGAKRAAFLKTIIQMLRKNKEQLLAVFQIESGLSAARASTELDRTIFQIQTYSELVMFNWPEKIIDPADKTRLPKPRPNLIKTVIPLGPIVVFGASNFPFAYSTIGGDVASALAAGCPVIVKSHPMHAGTGELVAKCVQSAAVISGMPNGIFSNLNIKSNDLAKELVLNSKVKGIGFTGSINGGKAIWDIANKRKEPIPVFAEMGSTNPVVISQGAFRDKEKWACQLADSLVNGNGQFCTCPGLIFAIDSDEFTAFKTLMIEQLEQKKSQLMLHPSIKSSFVELSKSVKAVLSEGDEEEVDNNLLIKALVLQTNAKIFLTKKELREEIFGPFALLISCENISQIEDCISILGGQLTGSLIADEEELKDFTGVMSVYEEKVGRIIFNGVPTGVEVSEAMTHGGPFPASTDSRFTAVGSAAILRWVRPVTYQNISNKELTS